MSACYYYYVCVYGVCDTFVSDVSIAWYICAYLFLSFSLSLSPFCSLSLSPSSSTVGSYKTALISACREAIKQKNFAQLFKIISED